MKTKSQNEILHGKKLSERDTEYIWGWSTHAGIIRAKRRARLICSLANIEPASNVLEIGCGTGLFTDMFAESGANITAIDISPDLLEIARKRRIARSNVEYLEQRFEDYDIDLSFDAIIGSSILHHLDIELSIEKIFRSLKPGGFMCFAEPNMLNPQIFAERTFLRNRLWYVSPDETAFIRTKLQKLLSQKGFQSINIIPFDWLHPHTPKSLISFINMLGSTLEKIPVIKEFSGSLCICAKRPDNFDYK